MRWHFLGFILRATVHEDASFRRPSSADTRRAATEIDGPDLSESRRDVPCCTFGLGKGLAPLVTSPEEAQERWRARWVLRSWKGMYGTVFVLIS